MKQNYPACEKRVLAYEGSEYTDGVHPYDPGGPTRWGITIADARMYWKSNATPEDVKDMPREIAEGIYKSKYWDKVNGDKLPSGVDETVFDYGVNSGVGRSGKVLRRCIGLPDNTSVINDEVLAALSKRDAKAIILAINDERLLFLQSLAIWPTYKNGWTKRVNDVKQFSLALANNATTVTDPTVEKAGKGKIKPPNKKVITTGGSAGPVGVAIAFKEWVYAHPYYSAMIAIGIVAGIILVLDLIDRNHKAKQETPMPMTPVPEGAANVGNVKGLA